MVICSLITILKKEILLGTAAGSVIYHCCWHDSNKKGNTIVRDGRQALSFAATAGMIQRKREILIVRDRRQALSSTATAGMIQIKRKILLLEMGDRLCPLPLLLA
jgi:hypothetical protein